MLCSGEAKAMHGVLITLTLAVALGAWTSLGADGGAGEDPAKAKVLAALRDTRAVLQQEQSSGTMIVTVTRWKEQNGTQLETPPARLEVLFDGSRVLTRQFTAVAADDAEEKYVLTRIVLGTEGKLTQFTTGEGPEGGPRAVFIEKLRRKNDEFPEEWSLLALTDVPSPRGWSFGQFAQIVNAKIGSITRHDDQVRVQIVEQPPEGSGVQKAEMNWEFDLALNGMTTKYMRVYNAMHESKQTGKRELNEMTLTHSYSWRKGPDGRVYPDRFVLEGLYKADGNVVLRKRDELVFEDIKIDVMEPAAISMGAMSIPEGTPVQDSVVGRSWKYFE